MAKTVDIFDSYYGDHPISNTTSIYDFISSILPNIYIFSGILLLIYLVFGGFMFITAGANPKGAEQGQQIMTNAIMGFAIIFVSYWIIQIIEILTGIQILSFGA